MGDNFDNIGVMTRVPALAESEDMDSVGADGDDADTDVETSPPIIIDRYGFSGGQQYTDPEKYAFYSPCNHYFLENTFLLLRFCARAK